MKKLILLFFIFSSQISYSQTVFDKELNTISADLAEKLRVINKTKIVVLYVTDVYKKQTAIGKYIADGISVDIVNRAGNFQVFDRDNLDAIIGAKRLVSEGYINASQAKEIGHLLSVDVIIVGTYTVLSNTVRLTLKSLDASTGFVIAATAHDLPLDADARALLFNGKSINGNLNDNDRGDNNVNSGDAPCPSGTGSLKIFNRAYWNFDFIQVIVSREKIDPENFRRNKYDLTSVSSKVPEIVPALKPGIYYIYLLNPNYSGLYGDSFGHDAIMESKRVAIEACKQNQVFF
jgi:TolB-like protein